jgi:hypothetical protein
MALSAGEVGGSNSKKLSAWAGRTKALMPKPMEMAANALAAMRRVVDGVFRVVILFLVLWLLFLELEL